MAIRVEGSGRLTADPEFSFTRNKGIAVAKFSLADNVRDYKNKGQLKANFYVCEVYGDAAEGFGELNVKKGQEIMFRGRLDQDEWTDKDGKKKRVTRIVIDQWGPAWRKKKAPVQEGAPKDMAFPVGEPEEPVPPLDFRKD